MMHQKTFDKLTWFHFGFLFRRQRPGIPLISQVHTTHVLFRIQNGGKISHKNTQVVQQMDNISPN